MCVCVLISLSLVDFPLLRSKHLADNKASVIKSI